MKEAGYLTGAIVSGYFVSAGRGFSQGFDYFNDEYDLGAEGVTSDKITNEAISLIDKYQKQKFFIFLHYFIIISVYEHFIKKNTNK